jgi:phenylacetate-CoA ligase
MTTYFDHLETRNPADREANLMARLPAQLSHAVANAPAVAHQLQGINAAAVNTRAQLATIPVMRKSSLLELQLANRANDPFGGFAACQFGAQVKRPIHRIFASPGPIYEPEGESNDYARSARGLFAAGLRAGDLVHNSFSYHMTPGAWILDAGAAALGCAVFPAGVGQTEQQVAAMLDLKPVAYVGTPSFLRILLEKADELGTPVTSLKKAMVSGEALPPSVRASFEARGIAAMQCYATADVGLIAYETAVAGVVQLGMMVDENILLEIVRPGTNEPVPVGEVGEVVVTTFNLDYPLVRFGTGDLSAFIAEPSACGRTGQRIRGWLGRADQTAKVKGMFVHPSQVAQVLAKHPEIKRARLVLTNPDQRDAMQLRCEVAGELDVTAVTQSLRDISKLGGEVLAVALGSLPNDGKVIDDQRVYQ